MYKCLFQTLLVGSSFKLHKLRMCSLGAKEVAAVDSCFAVVRARQHCIARHWTRHRVFLPVPVTSQTDPQSAVGLLKPQSPHYKWGTFAAMLTRRSYIANWLGKSPGIEVESLRHVVQRKWFIELTGHQRISRAQALHYLGQWLAMQCWRPLTRAKQLSIAATSLASKLHIRSWVVYWYTLSGLWEKSQIHTWMMENLGRRYPLMTSVSGINHFLWTMCSKDYSIELRHVYIAVIALEVTGTGRKTLCLVQCLGVHCWRALTTVKQLSNAATSLAAKLHLRSWVVFF